MKKLILTSLAYDIVNKRPTAFEKSYAVSLII